MKNQTTNNDEKISKSSFLGELQKEIDGIGCSGLTPTRAEYFKAGVRAAIGAVNKALSAAK